MARMSEVNLCSNVPIDRDNHPFFEAFSNQYAWFSGKSIISYSELSYTRAERTYVSIPSTYEDILPANYMFFRNVQYGNKVYFARITEKLYINDVTTRIYFEIDALQTFMFDITWLEMFVEREMVDDDWAAGGVPGYNSLMPEGLETGEYIIAQSQSVPLGAQEIYMYFTETPGGEAAHASIWQGVFTACDYEVFTADATGVANIQNRLNAYAAAGKSEAILSIMQVPANVMNGSQGPVQVGIDFDGFEGYIPKNSKLYTQEFYYLELSNNSGEIAKYPIEYFPVPRIATFYQHHVGGIQPTAFIYPMAYKGSEFVPDEGMIINNFPVCAWNSDIFKNWWSQNKLSTILSIGGGLLTAGAGMAVASPAAAASGVASVANTLANVYEKSLTPNQSKGQVSGDYLNVWTEKQEFTFRVRSIKREFAERIDKYFDMYGYKVATVKKPNLLTRPHWNYVKTRNCHIEANCSIEYSREIETLFDNGITLWRNGNLIGDYNRDNRGN